MGTELFSTLAREAAASSASTRDEIHETFFRTPQARRRGHSSFGASENDAPENRNAALDSRAAPVARAVLIDMEPKVVQSSLRRAKRSGQWRYDSARTLAFQSGSGNNWARGYNTYGAQTRETALELVRRETEACDHFGGFLLLQSMAGGTGAGLGAYVAEALRDEYAHAPLLNHCVWPHESGEVIVQSYNTLLTASALLDASDGVIVAQNDQLRLTCVKQLGIERPTFDDMNAVAAKQIAGVLLPRANGGVMVGADAARNSPGVGRRAHALHDLTRDVCQHPSARLLSLRQTPVMPEASVDFTTFAWPSLLKRTRQMLLSGATLEEGLDWGLDPAARGAGRGRHTKCLAASLFLRGVGSDVADASLVGDPALFPRWVPTPCAVQWSPGRFDGKEMSCTLLSNCQTPCPPIGRMLARAYQMRAAGAYTHQYAEHGVGDEEFEQAFARVEDVLATYRAL